MTREKLVVIKSPPKAEGGFVEVIGIKPLFQSSQKLVRSSLRVLAI